MNAGSLFVVLMDAQAAYLVSIGYSQKYISARVERIRKERAIDNTNNWRQRKAEEKEEKVKQLLKCDYGRPKVVCWCHAHIKAKWEKPCEIPECPTIAVRFVHVEYEHNKVECHMCLSHFNVAHRVLTDLP